MKYMKYRPQQRPLSSPRGQWLVCVGSSVRYALRIFPKMKLSDEVGDEFSACFDMNYLINKNGERITVSH